MIKILKGWFRTAFLVLDFASVCTIGDAYCANRSKIQDQKGAEEAALGGPILSGIGLSGSDRDERDSNLLDTSKEDVVSNNEVEKFGIPQCIHSHAMLLLRDLL